METFFSARWLALELLSCVFGLLKTFSTLLTATISSSRGLKCLALTDDGVRDLG